MGCRAGDGCSERPQANRQVARGSDSSANKSDSLVGLARCSLVSRPEYKVRILTRKLDLLVALTQGQRDSALLFDTFSQLGSELVETCGACSSRVPGEAHLGEEGADICEWLLEEYVLLNYKMMLFGESKAPDLPHEIGEWVKGFARLFAVVPRER